MKREIYLHRRRRILAAVTVTALVAIASGCAPSQQACADFNVALTQLKDSGFVGSLPNVDQTMEDYLSSNNVPGCSLAIVSHDEIAYLKGYGAADLGNLAVPGDDVPFTGGTMSRAGSISKTITALAVLKLAETTSLDLDDTIGQYLPAAPGDWSGLTIRQLLAHQAGFSWDPVGSYPWTENELLTVFPGAAPHPGIHPRLVYFGYNNSTPYAELNGNAATYSNVSYSLLGALTDYFTHSPGYSGTVGYEEYVWREVAMRGNTTAEPTMASMCLDTYWRHDDVKDMAQGYTLDGGGDLEELAAAHYNGWEGPSGGWAMTVGDLARLMIAMNTNKIVSVATKVEMFNIHGTLLNTPFDFYGYGTFREPPRVLHPGNIDGYTAWYELWPEESFGVALMCNRKEAPGVGDLVGRIRAAFGASGPPVLTDGDRSNMKTAAYQVATRYRGEIERTVQELVRRGGGYRGAGAIGKWFLSRTKAGKELMESLRRGDTERSAQLYLELTGRAKQ